MSFKTYRSVEYKREPRNGQCISGQLVYNMEAKNPQWGRVSSVNGAVGGNWTVSYKK